MMDKFAIHYSEIFASEILTLQELALVEPLSVGYHAANRGRVSEIDTHEGVSVAIEAVGLPGTFRLAIEAVSYAGRVVYVGYAKEPVTYVTTDFVRKELDILGSRNALRVFPAVIKMLEKRERPFGDLVTKVFPFASTAQALQSWDDNPARFTKILVAFNGHN
jgi:threonine dehydrogenase-like Zn-dependent dehydrogenase